MLVLPRRHQDPDGWLADLPVTVCFLLGGFAGVFRRLVATRPPLPRRLLVVASPSASPEFRISWTI